MGMDNTRSSNGWQKDGFHNKNPADVHLNQSDPQEDEIDLRKLVRLMFRHKWLLTSVVAVITGIAIVVSFLLTPIYKSVGTLLISESKNRYSYAGSDISNLLTTTYGIGVGSTIANELQILRSRKLSYELADTLLKQKTGWNGDLFPLLYVEYPSDPNLAGIDKVAYRIMENLEVSQVDREADLVSISFSSPSPVEAAYLVNLTIDVYSQLSTDQNRLMAGSALKFLEAERARIEQNLRGNEERLREYMNEKKLVQVDKQTEMLIETITELENQRQTFQTSLAAIGSAIDNYKQRLEGIKSGFSEQFTNTIGPKLNRYQYQLAEYETEKMLLLARNPELRDNPDSGPRMRSLNEKIDLLKTVIDEETKKLFNSGTGQYLGFLGSLNGGVSGNIGNLYQKLLELNVEQSQYRAQVEVLGERLSEYETVFNNLPDNMIELARLKRDVRINEELYLTVSTQFAEMSLWEQTQFGLGRPVDYGFIPSRPIFPNKPLFGLVGLVLGGVIAIGVVFAREAFNTKIDGVEKMEELDVPLLATIPDFSDTIQTKFSGQEKITIQNKKVSSGLIALLDSFSPAAEAFRRLHNNVVFAHPDRNHKVLMITSSLKGEGKSTVIANLAVILSESGKKVVILDADFRRPFVHTYFGLTLTPGITEYLFDEAPLEEALQKTVVENVDVITTGKRPPNPTAVSQSLKLREMIHKLKQQYDYVLIDTAPYGIITDAGYLIKEAEGIIVVSKFNHTHQNELVHTISNLKKVNANILGTVLTWFDYRKSTDYYYTDSYYKRAYEAYEAYMKK